MIATRGRPFCAVIAAAVFALCGWAGSAAAQQRVGVDSAVNPEATGTPPGGAARRIVLGQDVLFNERIATTASGQTQILFVDASSLTVGPNSNMVVDQFVYDPQAGTGKMAASVTKGLFRFVGGALSKGDNAVTFRTPTATIGIRGGVMLVDVNPNCGTATPTPTCDALQVVFAYGRGVTVTGLNGDSQTITRPGFQVTVAGPGASPTAPAPAPRATLGNFLAQLDGRSGANGGARTVPTEVIVEKSTAGVIASTATPTTQTFAATVPPAASNTIAQVRLNTQLATSGGSLSTATPVPVPVPPPPPPPPPVCTNCGPPPPPTCPPDCPPPSIANVAGGYADTSTVGTTQNGFPGAPLGYANGSVTKGVATIDGSFGQVVFPLVVGSAALPASGVGTSPLGPVTGTTFLSADLTFFYADLTPVNDPTQREFVYGGTPVNRSFYQTAANNSQLFAFAVQQDAALQSLVPFIREGTGGALGGAGTSTPLFLAIPAQTTFATGSGSTKALQASLAISGSGGSQQSVILVMVGNVVINAGQPYLTGVIHGSFAGDTAGQPTRINAFYATARDGNGNSFYGKQAISGFVLSSAQAGGGATETDTANQQTTGNYQFIQPAIATNLPSAVIPTQSSRIIRGAFGGIMTREAVGGGRPFSYVLEGDSTITTHAQDLKIAATLSGIDPFTAKESGVPNGIVLQFGSLQPGFTQARQAFITDNLFAALESPDSNTPTTVNGVPVPWTGSNPNIYLVTSTALSNALLPNGQLCSCKYLLWGYWGGEIDTPGPNGNPSRIDVGHINSWVAGPLTPNMAGMAAASAIGNYSGNLFGSVSNNGAKYLASGGFNAFYNFGTQAGSFNVSNYDGRFSFSSGTISLPLGGTNDANYHFSFARNGIRGLFNGSFYGPAAIETGGNFAFRTVAGTPYFTSGVYGGRIVGQ